MTKNVFKKYHTIGEPLLRLGVAITIIWSVVNKFTNTEMVAGMFESLGLSLFASNAGVIFIAVLLLIAATMLIFGVYTRVAAGFLSIFFLVAIISTFGGEAFAKVNVWKDFALLGIALFFLFHGSDFHSVDCMLKKKAANCAPKPVTENLN